MNIRFLLASGLFLALPIAFLSGCGGGSGSGFVNVTPTPTATATPTPTNFTTGNFNLSVVESPDSNFGFAAFYGGRISSYQGQQTHGIRYITLVGADLVGDGASATVTIRLNKSGLFAVGDSFDVSASSNASVGVETLAGGPQYTPRTPDPIDFSSNGGSGTVAITALSATSITLQLSNVKVVPVSSNAKGTVTFNGTVQVALPPV